MIDDKRPRHLFALMFCLILLLNINFTILKSVRSTLAVNDLGTGAGMIPIFELCGALPASILMTWGLTWLLNRISIQKVFFVAISLFLSFFLIFALIVYPFIESWRQQEGSNSIILQICSMSFYIMGELWKPALTVILFWGLVNQYMPLLEAKKLYAPLMLGGSIGSILAGPLVSFCTSESFWKCYAIAPEHWTHALTLMMLVVVMLGTISAYLYYRLWLCLITLPQNIATASTSKFSLKESIGLCFHNPQLRLLSWIVIADYIAYSLGEVIFLDVLKQRFPSTCEYCGYLGSLASWSGVFTVISALSITPYALQHCRWVAAAIATPICLIITQGAFFIFLCGKSFTEAWFGWSEAEAIGVIVLMGSIQYCLCRTAKYTLFDSSKELAYVLMPSELKMKGKLVVDGICARIGRGSASITSIILINAFGGVIASSFLTGVIAITVGCSWAFTTCKLGKALDKQKVKPLSS